MVYIFYIVLAILVIFLASKLSFYVDLLDKTTNLSGAFLGGVMLAAVTSIPELFTSLSSIFIVKEPDLVMGNILGSNTFNLTVLGLLVLLAIKKFNTSSLSKSHLTTCLSLIIINTLLIINSLYLNNLSIFGINVVSIFILVIYVIAVKTMSGAEDSSNELDEEEAAVASSLSTKQILTRFFIMSIALIVVSILITYYSDIIADKLNLGATFAGALLLAVATSLPEVVSSISLVMKGNFNATTGNILGSNLFNLTILFLTDLLLVNGTVFSLNSSANSLLYLGTMATIAMSLIVFISVKCEKMSKTTKFLIYTIASLVAISGYTIFLLTGK